MKARSFMSWSGGKDSALALYKAQQAGENIAALVTSVNASLGRVSMHGVRRELLQLQAQALGLPLRSIELPEMPGMETYENAMHQLHRQVKEDGMVQGVFGDIFLEDLKTYREALLAKDGLHCHFPLWGMNSRELLQQFFSLGFKAVVVCVNSAQLDKTFCGRLLNEQFIRDLPPSIDPCGENGEYHSFVFDGPNFASPIRYTKGEMVYKAYAAPVREDECFTTPQPSAGFYFCDLLPG